MNLEGRPMSRGLRAFAEGWSNLWHTPVRAERLGLMRLLLGLALLSDQLYQFLPHLPELYGPGGIAPADLRTQSWLADWRWTLLFFHTDDLGTISFVFWLWVAATVAFTAGFCTRLATFAVWLLTLAFLNRTRYLLNGGNDMMQIALFLLLLAPCGKALSVDAWLRRWRTGDTGPADTPAWPVRLIQFQLCMIYFSSGMLKLKGYPDLFQGTWYEGSSVHYTLNFVDRARWAYARFPLPYWMTVVLTYTTLAWEVLFPVLLLTRPTRRLALAMGILFHLGIFIVLELGWFCLYALCYYPVWVPDEFWARWDKKTEPGRQGEPPEVVVPA